MAGSINPLYLPQYSFTTGEISPDIADRYDLDQFKSSLLTARNCIVKPYGGLSKRPGMKYCGLSSQAKGKNIKLQEFNTPSGSSFMLEIYEYKINIWRNGIKTNIVLNTPYADSEIKNLYFTQSADTMFIGSGTRPVMTIKRNTDNDWSIQEYPINEVPFESINTTDTKVWLDGDNLNSTSNYFTPSMVGAQVKIKHNVAAQTISTAGQTSDIRNWISESFSTQEKVEWKFITHGTWTGWVNIDISYDGGATWKVYRSYTSSNDYNVSDSGTCEATAMLRFGTNSNPQCMLTIMPYTHTGYVKITGYNSPTSVHIQRLSAFPDQSQTDNWAISSFGNHLGFPRCIAFFQDRLVLGGTLAHPNRIYMSRTGDYSSFGVEKAGGGVTNDSAITLNIISRYRFNIRHFISSNNLIILTNGNEWIIDGSSTITPTSVTANVQSAHGSSTVTPIYIGSRCVYVQENGAAVRDIGYNYESDSYTGQDLSILAKHLLDGITIEDESYIENPNSIIYFLRSDGTIACLAYIPEQKVYAWSTWDTDGRIVSIESVQETDGYKLYLAVERNDNLTIEQIDFNCKKYVDCWKTYSEESCSVENEFAGSYDLEVVSPNYLRYPINEKNSEKLVALHEKDCTVGIPYTCIFRFCNMDTQLQDGTMQCRKSRVSACTVRVRESLGGKIGKTLDNLSGIHILSTSPFTGDKRTVLLRGEYTYMPDTSIYIVSDEPYPFNIQMIVREVEFSGGTQASYL